MPRRDGTPTVEEIVTAQRVRDTGRLVAAAAGSPPEGVAPLHWTFDTRGSTGPIASWTVDFGDGSARATGQGFPPASVPHMYVRSGRFTATLTLRSAAGAEARATVSVTVDDRLLAAPLLAGAAVAAVAGTPAPGALGAAIPAAAGGILAAFDRFYAQRRDAQTNEVIAVLERDRPQIAEQDRIALAAEEARREQEFQAKARARLDRDLRRALAIVDPVERDLEVDRILARERRYTEAREAAIVDRAHGLADAHTVMEASPMGAYWRLSPRLEHCEECLRMGGKVWPWQVLRDLSRGVYRIPPRHPNCGCRLYTIETALKMGWISVGDIPSVDQAMRLLLETAVDGPAAPWWSSEDTERWTAQREALLTALAPPAPLGAMESVALLGDELEVRHLSAEALAAGDLVMVDGTLEAVTEIVKPGVLRLERRGLVMLHRDTVRGVPGPAHPGEAIGRRAVTYADVLAAADAPVGAGWSKARRRAVAFGRFARELAASGRVKGAKGKVIRAYLALTVPGRYEQPGDELRLDVIDAARELALPLPPEEPGAGA